MSFVPLNHEARMDFDALADWQQDLVLSALMWIREDHRVGPPLVSKRRQEHLAGCRSFHIRGNRDDYNDIDAELRIVYRVGEHGVDVIAIGRRYQSEVYVTAEERMQGRAA